MDIYNKRQCQRFFKDIIDGIIKEKKLTIFELLNIYNHSDQIKEEFTELIVKYSKADPDEKPDKKV